MSTLSVALGCRPSLPSDFDDRGAPGEPPREPHVRLEPDSPLDAAPRVLRAHVVPTAGAVVDASRVLLVRGHVGEAHVRQVERGDISLALSERVLPAVTWSLDDGSAMVAPSQVLEPGETYGVLSGDPSLGADLHVADEDTLPLLRRAWPPIGEASGPFAVFCGDDELASPPETVDLAPTDVRASVSLGVFNHVGSECLRVDVPDSVDSEGLAPTDGDSPSGGAVAVPPPLLALDDGALVQLDPAPIPLDLAVEATAVAPLDCALPDVPFGPGCARVADDRLFVATPDAPLLWAVRSRVAGQSVRATRAAEPWVLHGLPPDGFADITLVALDAWGRAHTGALTVLTKPPMPHVVISEVLANPLGPEPDQEWIELYNDGLAPADLGGYTLADLGGKTPLPPGTLAPGAFALLVNEAFTPDDEIDPAPAPGTALLRVPKLGKDGLKNDGEPLKLLDEQGAAVSRVPLLPGPKAGESVARVSPSAPDGVTSSFTASIPTPGAPNETAR